MSVGASEDTQCTLDNTINTLKRCLQIVHENAAPRSCVSNSQHPSSSQHLTGTWSRDQHMFGCDEPKVNEKAQNVILVDYKDETQIGDIMRLITKDLSEPYSIYTYRYFIHNWPELCVLAYDTTTDCYVGAVVCKLDRNAEGRRKGYLAMLAIDELYRKLGLGTRLVRRAIERMQAQGCDEVVLETEVSNVNAQRLYSNLGFIREKRLVRYYLNGVDAFRLKLYFSPPMVPTLKSSLV